VLLSFCLEEAMEVDEDDSDLETPNATEGASESLNSTTTKRQQRDTEENSNLDSVDFTWLNDYFR